MKILSTLAAALLALVSLAAQAQDPPARVGRLAHTEGAVSVYMDPDLGWEAGYVNTPITSENSVWTDVDSRAELRVGPMAIRLDETTQLDIAELDEGGLHANVVRGAVNVRIRHFMPNDRIEIDTPNARFVLLGVGRYRIDADPERGDSRLTVFAGRAALQSGRGEVAVGVGSSVVVWGERSRYAMQRALTTDFDRWAGSLDSRWVERASPQYVSTYMTGYEDLDRYGSWIQEPDYGPLWIPTRVQSDWVPYRDGHWAWVRPWGWTWVSDQPWGYAPFHYGRWVYVRDRWAWYPGKRVERPVWAPALVAWVGGSNFSVGVRTSAPVVGWYPLSPFETYQPWYRANATYVTNINVNYVIRDRDRAYRYADRQREIVRERAATVVQRDALLSRRNVQQAMVRVDPQTIRQQQPAQQPSAVLPTRQDVVRTRTERRQEAAAAPARPSAASTARPGSTAAAGTPPGVAAAAPAMPPPRERPSFARQQAAPAAQAAPANVTPPPPAPVSRALPPGQAQSRFGPGAQPPAPGTPPSAKGQEAQERRDARQVERDQQQAREAQERAQQEAQKQQEQQRAQQQSRDQQQAREAQQRAQQEAQKQQEQQRAQQQQRDQQQAREAQQRAQQDAQKQQEQQRAQQEAQKQQERAARDAQQQRAQQAQQEQQRQQQERAAREAQQQQERAARDAQQQQQRAQQEAQKQQERAQQQQQRAQQEAQKQQERAQQEQQRAQQQQEQRGQQAQQAQQAQQPPPSRGREKTKEEKDREEKEKAEKEKGKSGR